MKKLALFLCMTLLFGCMLPLAASAALISVQYEVLTEQPEHTKGVDCYEVLDNTGFEVLDSPEKLYSWDITSHLGKAYSGLGSAVADRSTDAHGGSYSLKLKTAASEEFAHALWDPTIKPGETYELSAWVKKLTDCDRVVLWASFSGKINDVPQDYHRIALECADITPKDGWVKKTVRFTGPEHVQKVTIMLRLMGKGEVLWDDVSLLHITDKMPAPEGDVAKEPIKFLDLKNGGFEEDAVGEAPNPANGWEGMHDTKVTDEYSHSGDKSVVLRISPGQSDALIQANVKGFENGATYQLSGWIYNPEESKVNVSYWVNYSALEEFSYDPSTRMGQEKVHWEVRKTEDWQRLIVEFTPPDNVCSALIMIRLRLTQGVFYGDDFSLYMVKQPDPLTVKTDETFYYSEWEEGYCEAVPYTIEDPNNSSVEFSFVEPDGTEIHKETFASVGEGVKYGFRTEWMKELGKRYHIWMRVYGPDGALLQDVKLPVFRFDRPTYLGADGIFRKNGKEYTFTLGNGGKMEIVDKKPEEGGVTVVLLVGDGNIPILERLDRVHEHGLLGMVNLGVTAGYAEGEGAAEQTKAYVELIKDHPALFGYKIQDEPYQSTLTDADMIAAYEHVRNADPNHPVYVDDSVQGSYPWLYRYSDIMDIDYYGASDANAGRIMTDVMGMAMEASKGRKPFTILLAAFEDGATYFLPSVDEIRHQTYQAFFAGAHGYGFHTLADEGWGAYIDKPHWQEIKEGWASWERNFMFGCFVTGEYKFVNYQMTDDVLWGTFTDGTDIYAIVLNREKSAPKTAEIPLVDGAGTLKIDGYTATTMTGENKRITGSGTLSLELAPMEAVVWKVTPNEKVDFSHLKASKYRDIVSYSWAYNAIATLEEKGIINEMSPNWYGPQYNITRGDYAMFLVRALGLTAAAGENFADVDPGAEYAKELAIGKAAGIINGVGDNKFNPEAQITRQDMMTMTSRAMKLAGAADLGAFSDSGAIADYAQAHVSAMVAEGLIKGNADGTINPLGNTTRAEAAVIMNRIISK